MGGEIIMPLPDLAFEGGFGIDLDLLDVELIAEQLECWLDQPGVAHELVVDGMAKMQPHRGAHFAAPLLANIRGDVVGIDRRQCRAQEGDFLRTIKLGQNEEPVGLEPLDLGLRQPHRRLPSDAKNA